MIKQMIQVQTTKSIIICMWYASNILPMMNLKNIQKCFYMYEYVWYVYKELIKASMQTSFYLYHYFPRNP